MQKELVGEVTLNGDEKGRASIDYADLYVTFISHMKGATAVHPRS